ncbi:unnamed protein product [Heligmosomoides polygyrus]|uniref:DUF4218 domain-containing protein n=1 Tax=Heligmosomoides polygyrus TaxID=6339 RepID=A0A183G6Q7_HELPZ|nr:unnamed protein product [Heligmosomoides polygyrus]
MSMEEGPSTSAQDQQEASSGRRSEMEEDPQPADQDQEQECSSSSAACMKHWYMYMSNFKLHFGLSNNLTSFIDHLHRVRSREAELPRTSFKKEFRDFLADALRRYDHAAFYFCNACDGLLTTPNDLCESAACRIYKVAPKRSKRSRRTSVNLVNVKRQLELVLARTINVLVGVHEKIHTAQEQRIRARQVASKAETSDFDMYWDDIETAEEFRGHQLTVVLTVGFDGVRFSKLTRFEAYPIYVRLEGLPFHEKTKPDNALLAGALFTMRTPSETVLTHLFSRLQMECSVMEREGLAIADRHGTTWKVTPVVKNAIIDLAGMRQLYHSPQWSSKSGCHYCIHPGNTSEGGLNWTQQQDVTACEGMRQLYHSPQWSSKSGCHYCIHPGNTSEGGLNCHLSSVCSVCWLSFTLRDSLLVLKLLLCALVTADVSKERSAASMMLCLCTIRVVIKSSVVRLLGLLAQLHSTGLSARAQATAVCSGGRVSV